MGFHPPEALLFYCSALLHKREVIWLMPFYQSAMIS